MTELSVNTERIDDIPLLISQLKAMGLVEIINNLVPRHGNREGLSLGELIISWLAFILFESDPRPDLAQLKVLLEALDPLAIPQVTMPLPGNRADDGLYLPAIAEARQSIRQQEAVVDRVVYLWPEQLLLIKSPTLAASGVRGLQQCLSFPEALHTYRGGVPTIERDFSFFKERPLGLRPLFVKRDEHMIGLVRLLTLGLRVLTYTE